MIFPSAGASLGQSNSWGSPRVILNTDKTDTVGR